MSYKNIISEGSSIKSDEETVNALIEDVLKDDTFVFNEAIMNFSLGRDVLDLSEFLTYTDSDDISDFIQVTNDGTDTIINIDADGTGGYTDMTIKLDGVVATYAEIQPSLILS